MNQDIKNLIITIAGGFIATLCIVVIQYHSGWFEEVNSQPKIYFYFIQACQVLMIWASVSFLLSLKKFFKIWFDSKKYYREQFSLYALLIFVWISTVLSCSFIVKLMPWHIYEKIIDFFLKKATSNIQVPIAEYMVVFLSLILFMMLASQLHQKWDGKKSINQYKKEQNSQQETFLAEGFKELLRIIRRKPALRTYKENITDLSQNFIKPVKDSISKAWKDRACELTRLSSSAYIFDFHSDWYESQKCWVGENIDTKRLVILYPAQTQLNSQKLREAENTAKNIASQKNKRLGEIIVAFQKELDRSATPNSSNKLIRFETENSLLNNLVNFRDYYNEIIKRVENDKLSEADWTLKDVYVPSNFIGSEKTVEEYLRIWLEESSNKQIALLGEYGQGKSSAALMFVYHMIDQAKQNRVRIPILIELRGKSPRNLTTLEILSNWASQYRIDPQALLRLHVAGRLLLIFEGFDEMALIGNFEARLQHFRRLWEFCYPKAKILITGRPNFFLDDEEMRLSLGISQPIGDNHYCEAIRLKTFSIEQIEKSLRKQQPNIREQICSVARNNSRFYDLVARPSLLHVVSVIWEKENLGDNIESLNSAYVMERFVKYSYRRQGLKATNVKDKSRRHFMALNTAEREYFMSGIAAYMASNKLSNQITSADLNQLIDDLIDVVPNSVSASVDAMSGEDNRPLQERIREPEDIEHIKTDVRTCGLLVDDPAVSGNFKFGHKSFMEYLFAVVISDSIIEEKQYTKAIIKVTQASIYEIIDLPVTAEFFREIVILKNPLSTNYSDKEMQLFISQFLFIKYIKVNNKLSNLVSSFIKRYVVLPIYIRLLPFLYNYDNNRFRNIFFPNAKIAFLFYAIITILLIPSLIFTIVDSYYIFYMELEIIIRLNVILIICIFFSLSFILNDSGLLNVNKFINWIKICQAIGIENEIIHQVIGSDKLQYVKNKKFNTFGKK